MTQYVNINDHTVGLGHPTYIIAELSANHNKNFNQAVELIKAAKTAGVNAVKVQTYTADTLTMQSNRSCFKIDNGTLWHGLTLYDLYESASMPWSWQPKLKKIANDLGLDFFSSAFDFSSVSFLEKMGVPVHKLASAEIVDIQLIENIAKTGKPLIISTGMATLNEIKEAIQTARDAGAKHIILLKCTSAYPCLIDEMNLRTIIDLKERFNVPVGLSDHTLSLTVPVVAVALGACVVEKHLTLSRKLQGPDSAFSLEPDEFALMIKSIREVECSLGTIHYGPTKSEVVSLKFRRSLFAAKNIRCGEVFTENNVISIRPACGLPPKDFKKILGRVAYRYIKKGTPLSWDLVK